MKRLSRSVCQGLVCMAWVLPAGAAEPPAPSGLQSGGLKPPPAVHNDEPAEPLSPTEQELARADREDSGRGLEFVWLNAEVGGTYLGLQSLKDKQLLDGNLAKATRGGAVFGAGLGVRLLVFTFGARFRLANTPDWQLWTLNAEAGMHLPIGRIEPYATFGGGYASLGAFDNANLKSAGVSAKGFDVRAGVGLDWYVTRTFSIGGNLSGELLILSRNAVSAASLGSAGATAEVYTRDGSGIGAGATAMFVAGLHF